MVGICRMAAVGVAILLSGYADLGKAQPATSAFGPVPMRGIGRQIPPLPVALRRFLIAELSTSVTEDMKATTYVRWRRVGGDITVYISGGGPQNLGEMGGWCGSGGCVVEILAPSGASYRKIGDVQTWAPIRRLVTRSHGRPDLGVWVQGGGVYSGHLARIRFDGKHYPMTGTPPEGRKIARTSGRSLIAGDERLSCFTDKPLSPSPLRRCNILKKSESIALAPQSQFPISDPAFRPTVFTGA